MNKLVATLVAGLFALPQLGLAQPQEQGVTLGMQVRLDRLASEAEGYHYQVGYSPAMDHSLDELCGLVEPEGWAEEASFRNLGSLQTLALSVAMFLS